MTRYAWILLPFVAGLGLGLAMAYPDLRRMTYSPQQLVYAGVAAPLRDDPRVDPEAPSPKAVTESTQHNFGQMERGETLSHSFMVKNEGTAPLELVQGSTTCKCTLSGLDQDEIPAGGSGTVTLEWTATTESADFRQTATIHTNDPLRPSIEFVVSGKLYQEIEFEPKGLYINKLAGELKTYEVRATSVSADDFQVVGHSFDDESTSQFYEVTYRPLTTDELLASHVYGPEPRSGALVKVTLKPGLPQGTFRQTIRLDTNVPERPQAGLVVTGSVEGDISVVGGRGWNRDRMVLNIGSVPKNVSTASELKILVRGEHAGQVEFGVKETNPAQLQVSFGEPKALSGGRVQQTPMTIEIPSGLPPMSFMNVHQEGFGEVVLTTTHPDVPELRLKVRFAVEP